MSVPLVSVIVPNYNSRDLLSENIPHALAAARHLGEGQAEVIVVVDGSTDGSEELVREQFPDVRLVVHPENRGLLQARLTGVQASEAELAVFIDSDVRVTRELLVPIVEDLRDPSVFAVGCLSYRDDGPEIDAGVKIPHFKRGLLRFTGQIETFNGVRTSTDLRGPVTTLYAQGGQFAFRREVFLALGGCDDSYYPMYWDDTDLCYRAWKRGYRVLFDPRAVVYHRQKGTMKTHWRKTAVTRINHRNRFYFTWKNITSTRMFLREHLVPVALRFLFGIFILDWSFYRPLFRALPMLPAAWRHRRLERAESTVTDEGIFAKFSAERQTAWFEG